VLKAHRTDPKASLDARRELLGHRVQGRDGAPAAASGSSQGAHMTAVAPLKQPQIGYVLERQHIGVEGGGIVSPFAEHLPNRLRSQLGPRRVVAGPEVSVTSTKTYTSTAVVLALLGLQLGRVRDLSPAAGRRLIAGLQALPDLIEQTLASEAAIAELATAWAGYQGALYVGRVAGAVVAREGALKLKEVAYLHAEAYPASELKHGPLALVSPELPVVAVVPDDELFEKNVATLAEVKARGGRVLAVGHSPRLHDHADNVILVPKNEPELDPIVLGLPLQLFAYHVARQRGHDLDRPRNLAKSVTVE
jgi:glucosamine 6-phosphate synthetase-like amidotransferase/phosphosugar isomerase protein